jgi:hypothetical protein
MRGRAQPRPSSRSGFERPLYREGGRLFRGGGLWFLPTAGGPAGNSGRVSFIPSGVRIRRGIRRPIKRVRGSRPEPAGKKPGSRASQKRAGGGPGEFPLEEKVRHGLKKHWRNFIWDGNILGCSVAPRTTSITLLPGWLMYAALHGRECPTGSGAAESTAGAVVSRECVAPPHTVRHETGTPRAVSD